MSSKSRRFATAISTPTMAQLFDQITRADWRKVRTLKMSLTKKATARTHTEVLPMGFIQGLAEYSRSQYFVSVPAKFTLDDFLDPSFWRHITFLRPNDRLELVAEDGSWDVDARVVSASPGFAVLRALREWRAPTEALQGEPASRPSASCPGLAGCSLEWMETRSLASLTKSAPAPPCRITSRPRGSRRCCRT